MTYPTDTSLRSVLYADPGLDSAALRNDIAAIASAISHAARANWVVAADDLAYVLVGKVDALTPGRRAELAAALQRRVPPAGSSGGGIALAPAEGDR